VVIFCYGNVAMIDFYNEKWNKFKYR